EHLGRGVELDVDLEAHDRVEARDRLVVRQQANRGLRGHDDTSRRNFRMPTIRPSSAATRPARLAARSSLSSFFQEVARCRVELTTPQAPNPSIATSTGLFFNRDLSAFTAAEPPR